MIEGEKITKTYSLNKVKTFLFFFSCLLQINLKKISYHKVSCQHMFQNYTSPRGPFEYSVTA